MATLTENDKNKFTFLYHLYTTLYMNDAACNYVKEVQPFINPNDKEALKIYGALRKRAVNYLKHINNFFKDAIIYLAVYNENLDITSDKDIEKLCNSIALIYKKNGVDENLAKIETMRILIELSVGACKESYKVMKVGEIHTCYEMLNDMARVANNLWDWTLRKVRLQRDTPLDIFSYKSVNKRFDKVKENIFNSSDFIRIYNKMANETA